ncbi:MAG: sulfotransferase [Bacteroidota bacterium]
MKQFNMPGELKKFVIITLPRSGSTVLVKTLDRHPQVFCAGELFYFPGKIYHTECQFPFWKIKTFSNKINYLINFPNVLFRLGYFMKNFYNHQNPGYKAVGFKMMYQHILYMPGIMNYLKRNKIKVILLTRENLLRNVLSDMKARETGVYHNEPGSGKIAGKKLHVDLELLSEKMKETGKWAKKLEAVSVGMDTLKIDYADFTNWEELTDKIFDFLEVSREKIPPAAQKLNPPALENMIDNFEEVKQWAFANGYSENIS